MTAPLSVSATGASEQETGVETDPVQVIFFVTADADPGTIRADFATSIEENVVHGSDGSDTAREEIAYFFSTDQVCPRTR